MSNPAVERFMGTDSKKVGRKAESRFAKRTGSKLTPASGAAGQKGDATLREWLIEHKNTIKDSMGVKLHWLRKISHEASLAGRVPALAVSFSDESGRSKPGGRWVMIPEEEWRRLTDEDRD